MAASRLLYSRSALLAAAAGLLLPGCSMASEWWVARGLRDAGMTKPAARCVVRGVVDHLSRDQIYEVRRAVSYLDPPPGLTVESLLSSARDSLAPEIFHVLDHYVTHCRSAA